MGRVEGKVAIVTGAASGLGLADAERLAGEGAQVVLTDLNTAAGEAAAARIGGRFIAHDVADEAAWGRVIAQTEAAYGALHILVNNAGIVSLADPEAETLDNFRRVNRVMSESVFLGCRAALPLMARSGAGSIVNMSSVASHLGYPIFFAYTAAKGAVRAMTKAIAIHCQDRGYPVRCNSVHPGAIETPMIQGAMGRAGQELAVPQGVLPPGAVGHPRDVADLVLYLASDESRFVTGAEFVIDNGLTVRPA